MSDTKKFEACDIQSNRTSVCASMCFTQNEKKFNILCIHHQCSEAQQLCIPACIIVYHKLHKDWEVFLLRCLSYFNNKRQTFYCLSLPLSISHYQHYQEFSSNQNGENIETATSNERKLVAAASNTDQLVHHYLLLSWGFWRWFAFSTTDNVS